MSERVNVVDRAAAAHAALSPLRRTILQELEAPASATELADRLEIPRQKLNYHLRVLERHGLVALAEERRRRGFIERRYARSGTVILAPDLVEPEPRATGRDEMSADALVAAACDAIRAVGALGEAAGLAGKSLVTATLAADVTFGSPGDLRAFLEDAAALASRYDAGPDADGARYRVSVLSHPTVPDDGSNE